MHGSMFTVDGGRVMVSRMHHICKAPAPSFNTDYIQVAGLNDGIEMPADTNTYGLFQQ